MWLLVRCGHPRSAERRNKMPNREEMRGLVEEIISSHEDRIAGIAQLRETVKLDLREFQDSRLAMGMELHADLAKSVADRRTAVSTQLKELDAAHAVKSREMRAELTRGRQTLTEEETKRQSEAREFIGELCQAVAEGKAAAKAQLKELEAAQATMSRELKTGLAKGEAERQREARALKQELIRGVTERKSAVSTQLKELADIQAGVRDEWQKLSALMKANRGVSVVKSKPLEAAAASPVEEITEDKAAEITPETTTFHDQIFEYLANHPDGARMTELEQEFDVPRIKLARILGNLKDANKVEKKELFYFAI